MKLFRGCHQNKDFSEDSLEDTGLRSAETCIAACSNVRNINDENSGFPTPHAEKTTPYPEGLNAVRHVINVISHDIRTPLTTIGMSCNLMSRELAKNELNKEKISNSLKIINNVLKEISFLINSAVNNSHDPKSELSEFRIIEALDTAVENYPFCESERDFIQVKCDENFSINANRTSIIQILYNLIKNSLYRIHSANRGKIIICTYMDGERKTLSFKDTADGLSSAVYDRLFEINIDENVSKLGFDLFFCKKAMDAIGGAISCKNIEGESAEFILVFP